MERHPQGKGRCLTDRCFFFTEWSMVVSGSPKRWWVAYNPPEVKDYKWYISGMYIQPIGGWTISHHLLEEPFQQPLKWGLVGVFQIFQGCESLGFYMLFYTPGSTNIAKVISLIRILSWQLIMVNFFVSVCLGTCFVFQL